MCNTSAPGSSRLFCADAAVVVSRRSNNLPMHHPDWWFIDFAGADQQFAAEQAAYRSVFKS